MDKTHPFWRRPTIVDPHLGPRRMFWDELSDEQKFEELNYQAYKNRQLFTRLKGTHHERT